MMRAGEQVIGHSEVWSLSRRLPRRPLTTYANHRTVAEWAVADLSLLLKKMKSSYSPQLLLQLILMLKVTTAVTWTHSAAVDSLNHQCWGLARDLFAHAFTIAGSWRWSTVAIIPRSQLFSTPMSLALYYEPACSDWSNWSLISVFVCCLPFA